MKKRFKKVVLSLSALAFLACAGVGVSLTAAHGATETKVAKADTLANDAFYMSGAGIRLINDANGTGIRFHSLLSDAEYEKLTEGCVTGTLVIPESRYDGEELTLDDLSKESKYRPVNIETTNIWYDSETDGYMQSTAYLYNIPESFYGMRYVARSYVTYENGTTVYAYTSSDRFTSMSDVAIKAQEEHAGETIVDQVDPYVVDEVTFTYELPDGATTETMKYGATTTPSATVNGYEVLGWEDQYGRPFNGNISATVPLTLTPTEFGLPKVQAASSPFKDGFFTASATTAPTGFSSVSTFSGSWDNNNLHFGTYGDMTDLSAYSTLYFAIKGENVTIKPYGTTGYTTSAWIYFTYTKTAETTWTVNAKSDDGAINVTVEGISGAAGSGNYNLNALTTLIYGANDYAKYMTITNNGDGVVYVTEVLGNLPSENEYRPTYDASTALDSVFRASFVTSETGMVAPSCFETVSKYNETWSSSIHMGMKGDDTDLSAYSDIYFAMRVVGGNLRIADVVYSGGNWVYFHYTQNGDGTWNCTTAEYNGSFTQSYANKSTSTTAPYVKNALNALLYQGSNSLCAYPTASGTADVYSTEVRGVLADGSTVTPPVVDTPEVEEDTKIAILKSPLLNVTETTEVAAPTGFTMVSKSASFTGTLHTGTYGNKQVVAAYTDIYFAIKVTGDGTLRINGTSGFNGEWIYFHYKHNDGTSWQLSATKEDGTVVRAVALNASYKGANYPENAISTLIYNAGCDVDVYSASGNCSVYSTEILANALDFDTGIADNTMQVATAPYRSDRVASTTEVSVPQGYSTVNKYTGSWNGDTYVHSGMMGDKTNLSDCTDLYFAMRVENGTIVIGNETYDEKGYMQGWVYFHYYRDSLDTNTWSLYAKSYDGTFEKTITGIDATAGGDPETYPLNAISTLMYKGSSNVCVSARKAAGATANVYVTEVLGVVPVEGDRIIWAAADGAAPIHGDLPVNYPMGFAALYEKTDFKRGGLAAMDLSNVTSTTLRFKMLSSHLLYVDKAYTDFADAKTIVIKETVENSNMYLVTLTKTEQGWHVVMDCTLSYSLDNSTWNNADKFEFDSTEQSLSRIFKMISTASSQNVTLYVTEVRGEHTVCSASKYTYLGNGTHKAECICGAVMIEAEACSGGVATCTDGATCATCKGTYKAALGHDKVWTDNVLSCQRDGCNIVLGTVETNLAKQNVALYTDAAAINATQSVGATIDLSGATELSISDIQNVALGGVSYSVANFADNKVTINVLPQDVFGEYTFTATITVEGKTFEISMPVLVVTNAVTSQTGLLAMKDVLRGENGMNGDGYYLLNNHVELTYDANYVYAFGIKTLPFVGTFDGNGYAIKNFKTAPYPSSEEEDETYKQYVEASLFGVMDGTVKNVAMTNVVIGGMTNISHSGNGLFENVYLEVAEYTTNYGSYCEPFFARAAATKTQGTLKNVVVKMTDLYNTNAWAIYQRYLNGENVNVEMFPAAVGDSIIADNVALYGYDSSLKDYERRYEDGTLCTASGRGGVYSQGNSIISHDGKEASIYVEYIAGGNNGGLFGISLLDENIWAVVNDEPIFKSLVGAGEGASPEEYLPEQSTDDYVALDGDTQYLIAWNDNAVGSSVAATLVNDVMYSATGVNLTAAKADPANEWKKQIIIGSFEEYSSYVTGLSSWTFASDRVNYGVYLENRTIYVLSDGEDGFALAAQELCRRLFGWQQLSPSQVVMDNAQTVELPAEMNYTTSISFSQRQTGTHLTDSLEMNFNCNTHPYTQFGTEMHNITEFFDKNDSTWKKYYTTLSTAGDKSLYGNNICFLGAYKESLISSVKWDFDAIVNHVVELLVAKAKEKPDAKVFNLMIADSFDYCNCTRCQQFTNKSVTVVLFMNEVAKKLKNNAELGGRTIGIEFFAYASFEKAPVVTTTELNYIKNTLGITADSKTVTYKAGSDYTVADAISAGLIGAATETVLVAEDNLRLWWTSQKANHAYSLKHRANAHMYYDLQGWLGSVSAANVDVYMYQSYFQDYLMPLNTWEYQIAWYRELNELGVNAYMFNLGQYESENTPETQTGFMSFKTYIDSRALTDTTVSYATIKEEFFATDGYFGAAGPTMKTYFNSLESVLNSKKQADGLAISSYLVSKKNADTDLKIRQLYFNGFFGPSYSSLMIDYANNSKNFYKLYTDDQLKQWYTYCTEALDLVKGDALYEKRIKAEAIFPYYMLLLQNSKPTYSSSKWTFTEYGNGYTFQGLADLIHAVGTTCQREHYTFEQTGKGFSWQGSTYEYNLFARWGLTYNPQA